MFIDRTHIKAYANIKKRINKNISKTAKVYEKHKESIEGVFVDAKEIIFFCILMCMV